MTPEAELEAQLSEPTAPLVAAMRDLDGDILILGAAGKMGPTLAQLARRATDQAGVRRRIVGVARFSDSAAAERLRSAGVETIACDLFDGDALGRLPDCPNVISMIGQKFGTTGQESRTWAVNAWLAGAIATRFARSRIVAFSTGNIYPLAPVHDAGPDEDAPVGPVGEYAQSALARERILSFFGTRNRTPMALLRLNYAVEPRYGVLRDIADKVWHGRPVDVTMGYVNVIWQRDANALALRAFAHCATPPLVLNVTGQSASVRGIAEQFGARLHRRVVITGTEAPTALLSDAARAVTLFGPPSVDLGEMIDHVARWVEEGGASLGKPTHFEERRGLF